MSLKLSEGQEVACERLVAWWRGDPCRRPFRLDGYAGTGKTTVVEYALKALGLGEQQVRLLAPTGKAARVLSDRTGWTASTIHKELYQPAESEEVTDLKEQLREATGDEREQIRHRLARLERKGDTVSFADKGPGKGDSEVQLYVVDEHSMVGERQAHDLQARGLPLLLLGDPGQLKPVKSQPGFRHIKPDVTLTEIRRQDAGSAILRAADLVRRGEPLPDVCDWGAFKRIRPREMTDDEYAQYDMLLCGTHRVRKAFNRRLRRRHFPDLDEASPGVWLPREDDQLVVRANDYRRGVLNGQLVRAGADALEEDDLTLSLDVVDDNDLELHGQTVNALRFKDHYLHRVAVHKVDQAMELDFAYALTVHSAQGSEWSRIVVLNDWRGGDHERWLYTALTRGADEVVLVG